MLIKSKFHHYKCFRMDADKNSTQVFRVEALTDEQFRGHLQNLHTPISQLNPNTSDYLQKRKFLQFATEWRAQSADNLRIAAQTTVTAAAVDGQWTAGKKANRLVKLRSNLMKARECFTYAQIGSTDGFDTAHKVSLGKKMKIVNCLLFRFSGALQ